VTSEDLAPSGVDPTKASIARVYDFMLGGKDNFAVDRQASLAMINITPDGPEAGRANRAFLRRIVQHLVRDQGIRQFLDLGSGLPTVGNVHEVAQQLDQGVKVVYVDNDPMALAHGRALLANASTATVIQADIRRPAEVLNDAETLRWIDFSRPVGLLMLAILHHLNDHEHPGAIAKAYRDALAPGSYLAISHFCDPGGRHPDASAKAKQVEKVFNETLGTGRWRSQEEIISYFGDLELLEPGVVPVAEWRAEPGEVFEQTDTRYTFVGGLARKP
jgi:hypothetical protein